MTSDAALTDAAIRSWQFYVTRVHDFVAPLSDEQLEQTIAPERNRLLYLLGHIAAVHDRMIPLLGIGERLHPELDATFLESGDSHAAVPFTGATLKAMLHEINAALMAAYTAWTPVDWLARHTAVSEEDFAREPHRNRYSVLLSRTGHLASHYGQMVLTKAIG
jgi:hypothetical protein